MGVKYTVFNRVQMSFAQPIIAVYHITLNTECIGSRFIGDGDVTDGELLLLPGRLFASTWAGSSVS